MADDATKPHIRPYIVRMYDRWIILALILALAWFARPVFAYSLFYRGVTFEHMLILPTAEHYYKKSINVYDKIPQGWVGLGELYLMRAPSDRQKYADAVDTFATGLALNPGSFTLAFDLGRTYFLGKDWRAALASFDRAVQIVPSSRFALDFAAWSAYNLGNRKLAFTYWHRLLALYPGDAPVRAILRRFGG